MKTAHFSDVHGSIDTLGFPEGVEALISTGDFFPNQTRGIRSVELAFQASWFAMNLDKIFRAFAGRPIVCVDGNHDFISLAECLIGSGYPGKVIGVTAQATQDFFGFNVAGFREIPYIAGEWNGEVQLPEIHDLCDTSLQTGCDILLTHTPPKGILSGEYGCSSLTNLLAYSPHNVRYHFFGHCHKDHGTIEDMGVKFSNAATSINIVDLV